MAHDVCLRALTLKRSVCRLSVLHRLPPCSIQRYLIRISAPLLLLRLVLRRLPKQRRLRFWEKFLDRDAQRSSYSASRLRSDVTLSSLDALNREERCSGALGYLLLREHPPVAPFPHPLCV